MNSGCLAAAGLIGLSRKSQAADGKIRVGDQIRQADKMKIPFVIAVGTNERESGRYIVKNLATGAEITLPADRIAEHLFSSLG